ncbi:ArnT family glycosyltransferase [Neorhodopirellula pilleata]|uniref:Dolichyl-phosphate-mannose-protein mannosyltransferase n=1 Tax=Neorhodopirellula pilleata TaxID=2714738 RepID=A0A5C6A779_9BACT|nr:glycosyltransferase family 39 protein [Neorhodopirellula pilleata]TWT95148.1 Dolichyl-phosphate-mannose-protein mannosyltransferase [Neorhodopirellula pilleata]
MSKTIGLLAIVLLVLIVRGGLLLTRVDGLSDDPDAYRVIAETLARTGVFGLPVGDEGVKPTAFRPPLYPWVLSFLTDSDGRLINFPVAILHAILGTLTVLLTWDIARRLLGRTAAVVATVIVTLDPILMWQSTLVMTETLATFLTIAVFWWWVIRFQHGRDRTSNSCEVSGVPNASVTAAGLGVLLSLAFLCRPTFLVWAILVIPMVMFAGPACSVRRGVIAVVSFAIVAVVMAAWTARNVAVMGHPIWATSHGGYTLLLGNNESFYGYLRDQRSTWPWNSPAWDAEPFFEDYANRKASGDEVADDETAYQLARTTINQQPDMFVYSCWVRFVRLWQPFPHATSGRSTASIVAVGSFYVLVYALIVIASIQHASDLFAGGLRRMMMVWPAIALFITLSGVHAVYWSNPRMRAPANPVLAIAASAAFLSRRNLSLFQTAFSQPDDLTDIHV